MSSKILITGNAGSGKSTTARRIGGVLGREVISLDSIVWQPGWRKTDPDARALAEREIADRDQWIVDGVSTFLRRAADLVVFLDYPRGICLLRCLARNRKYLFRSRPELPEGCPEIKIAWHLFKIIKEFPDKVRPGILSDMADSGGRQSFVHIRSNEDLDAFFAGLKKST